MFKPRVFVSFDFDPAAPSPDLEALAESSLSGNARVGNTSVSGRGAGRYNRLDPWSWLSLQRAQA